MADPARTGALADRRALRLGEENERRLDPPAHILCVTRVKRPLVGLHAKVFAFEAADQARLFLGSANATGAALNPNVEILAELAHRKPGVVLVTSGPGTKNLATGLLTANTEAHPVVALCGAVAREDRLKRSRPAGGRADRIASPSHWL